MRHSKQFWPLLNILATLLDKQTLSVSPPELQLSEPWAQIFPAVRTWAACAMVSTDSCTCNQEWGCCARSSETALLGASLEASSYGLSHSPAWAMLLFCSLAMFLPEPDPLISVSGLPLICYIPEDLSGKHWLVLWPCVVSPELLR